MTAVFWACSCGERGSYPTATAPKTDSALKDAKHQAACTGSVLTSTSEAALGRMVRR